MHGSPIPGVPVHHNIAPIVDGGIASQEGPCVNPFLVLGRSGVETLRTRLGRGFPGESIRSIAIQIADAIDAAHSQGVMLERLNPKDVLFESATDDRIVIVFDMYALYANCFDENLESPMPQFDLNYLAPELFSGSPQGNTRSDIYSFAVMVFEVIAGRRPYASLPDLEKAMTKDELPPDIREFRDVPEEISIGLSRMLSRDPLKRPSSAKEAIAGIETPLLQL